MEAGQPTKTAIEQELRKILASDRFRRAKRLSDFLEFIVRTYLETPEGKKPKLSETIVRQEVFGRDNLNENDTIVRFNARKLRERLDTYYANEGRDDPLRIDMPPQRYDPTFTRLESFGRAEQLRTRAVQKAAVNFPEHAKEASHILEGVIKEYPSFAPAHASYAELTFKLLCCNVHSVLDSGQLFSIAASAAIEASQLDPELALPYIILGALYSCRFEWEDAETVFATALSKSPEETKAHWFYAAFLLAIGRKAEALNLVHTAAQRSQGDRNTYGLLELFMYAVRDYTEIDEQELGIQGHAGWMEDVLYACTLLEQGKREHKDYSPQICQLLDRIFPTPLTDDRDFSYMPYLGLYISALATSNRDHLSASASQRFRRLQSDLLDHHERERRMGAKDSFKAHIPGFDPVQLALACMGVNDKLPDPENTGQYDACDHLSMACAQHHPLMVWLHLWPIFDPLRNEPKFKALIKRMGLPT